jgi:hypothetical protein
MRGMGDFRARAGGGGLQNPESFESLVPGFCVDDSAYLIFWLCAGDAVAQATRQRKRAHDAPFLQKS